MSELPCRRKSAMKHTGIEIRNQDVGILIAKLMVRGRPRMFRNRRERAKYRVARKRGSKMKAPFDSYPVYILYSIYRIYIEYQVQPDNCSCKWNCAMGGSHPSIHIYNISTSMYITIINISMIKSLDFFIDIHAIVSLQYILIAELWGKRRRF